MPRVVWIIITAVLAFMLLGSVLRLAGRLVNIAVLIVLLLVVVYFATRSRGEE